MTGGISIRTVNDMAVVFEILIVGLVVAGMATFVVWAIRNRPSDASSRSLDRDTELANAEARARAQHGGGI